jgi:hypothetical protein
MQKQLVEDVPNATVGAMHSVARTVKQNADQATNVGDIVTDENSQTDYAPVLMHMTDDDAQTAWMAVSDK